MTAQWIFEHNVDDSARFLLGVAGMNPLICVGVNPSIATPAKLDLTVTRIKEYARLNGHDCWMMLNLYPQRSTDPTLMHTAYLPELKSANEGHIADFIGGRTLTLLAAWGEKIRIRPYLPAMLKDIVKITDASACDWTCIGAPLKNGHPRHPSRGSYLGLQSFDIGGYLRSL